MLQIPILSELQPVESGRYFDREMLSSTELDRYFDIGLEAVSQGKVAVITLAGGQASRLGSSLPKGVIQLGTGLETKNDSLLFLQASQISYIQQKAFERFKNTKGIITWLIMTSKSTDVKIREHLDNVLKETGLFWEQVIIFVQNEIPALDFDGHVFMSSTNEPVLAPDGNGGMYQVIAPILPKLEQIGIEYFHVYCVDNILVRVPDLYMIGFAIDKKADCALKVIQKKNPMEKVGNVCVKNGKLCVLEYSEIPKDLAEMRDPSFPEKLFFCAGNIANHFFTLNFLQKACLKIDSLPYHSARKRITYMDLVTKKIVQPKEENGIKRERFIFDAFIYSENFMVWQVPREEEFSPLKNPDSAGVDCLSTCLRDFNSVNGEMIREICKSFCKKD